MLAFYTCNSLHLLSPFNTKHKEREANVNPTNITLWPDLDLSAAISNGLQMNPDLRKCSAVCVCVCVCVSHQQEEEKTLYRTFLGSSANNGCSERNHQNAPKYTETMMLIVSWPQLDQKPFFKKSFRKTQSFFAKQLCANNRKTLHVIDTKHCRYGQALSSDGKITWKKTASIINKEELNYYACLREIKKSIRDKKEKTQFELLLKSLITTTWRGGTCAFSLNLEKSVKGLLLMCSTLPSLFKPPLLYAYIWILPENII